MTFLLALCISAVIFYGIQIPLTMAKVQVNTLAVLLAKYGHWSPFEHQAQAHECLRSGNFTGGWKQYRSFFKNENREKVDLQKLMDEKPDWISV